MYKEDISAAYNISDAEIEYPPPIYERGTKNKTEELGRLHAAMRDKLVTASNTEKLQILTSVLDSWSQKYCYEYFGVFNSVCKGNEAKKVDTCTAFPEKK